MLTPRVHRLGPFELNAAPILMNKYVASAPVIEYATAADVHAAPTLVNESVASSPVIEYVTPTPVHCPQLLFIEKTVEIPDFLLCQGTQTAESSAIAPVRHVPFAETVEVVEFDPAVHAAPLPVIEYDAPAPNLAYLAHAAPAPMVENDAPASTVEYQAHAEPAPVDEYDAPAALPVVQVVQIPQVPVVKKTIEIPQLQIIWKIVEIPEIQTVQSTQSSESLETTPVLEMAPAEIVEGVEFGPPLQQLPTRHLLPWSRT